MNPATQARLSLAAVLATLLAALCLAPLVQGVGWFVAVVVVVAVNVGVASATRQLTRAWPLVLGVQLVAVALVITVVFVRDLAVGGVFPGPAAVHGFAALVTDGTTVTREQGAPVTATPGLIFLITAGIAGVSVLVDLIAVSLRRPAAAGLPLLAVYCVPAAVLRGGLPWPYFVLGALGYLILVGADSGDRVHNWGRVLSSGRDGARALGGPLSGSRRLAAGCLLAAVLVPAAIPGLSQRLVHGSGTGSGQGDGTTVPVVNPLLTLRANLTAQSNTPVITYTTSLAQPDPLRIVTADTFDGETWAPATGISLPRSQQVQDGLPIPPGLTAAVPTEEETTDITVGRYQQTYLPLPYPSTVVQVDGTWLYDARTLNVVAGVPAETTQGLSYVVEHLEVSPTAAELEAAGPPPASVEDYLKLPGNLPAVIAQTARQQAGTGSAYDQAVRLQQWLRSTGGFVYSTQASGNGSGDSGEEAVAAFLREKHGYCVQFASAMAVMARTLGIPARVAVGFLPGVLLHDGKTWQISLHDAHAWPELYFSSVGWVRFEPTPASQAPNTPAYSRPGALGPTPKSATTGALPVPVPRVAPKRPDPVQPAGTAAATSTPLLGRVLGVVPWRVLLVLAALLVAAAAPMAAAALVRRRRWRRAFTPTQRAEAAWEELGERLSDLRVSWAPSWTPRILAQRLVQDLGLSPVPAAALGRVVADLEQARYAPPGSAGRSAAALAGDVAIVVGQVAAQAEPAVRRRARWLPASGVAALTGVARSVDVLAGDAGQRASDLGEEVRSEVRRTVGSGRN